MAREIREICPGLVIGEEISVETSSGTRQIQLLFGDMTSLTAEHQMDVVIMSAFHGNARTITTMMISALMRKFKLCVNALSQNKAQDLRKHFHCWWSKPMRGPSPFRQLLWCESPRNRHFRHPAELVSHVFRSLVTMFDNQEKTVITPLLSAGNQGFSSTRVLNAMLGAAVNWMHAGLPLKVLRIVVYTADTQNIYRDHKELISVFQEWKKTVEKRRWAPKNVKIKYDVYLSYHNDDKDQVDKVLEVLKKEKQDMRIFSRQQHLDAEAAWQNEIHDTMLQCARVVTFLSPRFLESSDCLEQFNLALVCNRTLKRSLLTPFYLITIDEMPNYMESVQFVDCRDPSGSKTRDDLTTFVGLLTAEITLMPVTPHYDVFISYSHRNTTKAQAFVERLQQIYPAMCIFYDRIELKAGSSWQQDLYVAIDSSDIVLCLISSEYLSSTVCAEEYNLALAKHLSPDHELELVPLLIEDLPHLPYRMGKVKLIDAKEDYNDVVNHVSGSLAHFIRNKAARDATVFNTVEIPTAMNDVLAKHREEWFGKNFRADFGCVTHRLIPFMYDETLKEQLQQQTENDKRAVLQSGQEAQQHSAETSVKKSGEVVSGEFEKTLETDTQQFDVAFISADYRYAYVSNLLLKYYAPTLKTNLESEHCMLRSIENSRIVVPLLSSNLIFSSKCVDEFNVALARHRKSTTGPVLYAIQLMGLPEYPTYLHLVPCNIALQDKLWKGILDESGKSYPTQVSKASELARRQARLKLNMDMAPSDMLALEAACLDIIALLRKERDNLETKNVVLHNIHVVYEECMVGVPMDAVRVNTSEVLKTLDSSYTPVFTQPAVPDATEIEANKTMEEENPYKLYREELVKMGRSACIIS